MAKSTHDYTQVAKRIEDSLDTIRILAEVLIENGGCKGNKDEPPQIDERGEEGIYQAVRLIASASHRDFCQLATDLEIPQ